MVWVTTALPRLPSCSSLLAAFRVSCSTLESIRLNFQAHIAIRRTARRLSSTHADSRRFLFRLAARNTPNERTPESERVRSSIRFLLVFHVRARALFSYRFFQLYSLCALLFCCFSSRGVFVAAFCASPVLGKKFLFAKSKRTTKHSQNKSSTNKHKTSHVECGIFFFLRRAFVAHSCRQ